MGYNEDLIDDDASALWKFDITTGLILPDEVGSYDLTIGSGVTKGQAPVWPSLNKSFRFNGDGTNSFCYNSTPWVPTDGVFGCEINFVCEDLSQLRQCIWFNGSLTGYGMIINGGTSPNTNGEIWLLRQGVAWHQTNGVITANTPYHLIVLRNTASVVKIYLNETVIYELVHGAWSTSPTGPFCIGCENELGGSALIGRVDSAAWWNQDFSEITRHAHWAAVQVASEPHPDADVLQTLRNRRVDGSRPYTLRVGAPDPNGFEHYDPAGCFQLCRDWFVYLGEDPQDWSAEINRAIYMWRDEWVLAISGETTGYHRHSHGMARHYLETGDTQSRVAVFKIMDDDASWGPADVAEFKRKYTYAYWQRELAFWLLSAIDRHSIGGNKQQRLTVLVDALTEIITVQAKPLEQQYGVFIRTFMTALALRSLVAFYFYYRDDPDPEIQARIAIVPGIIETGVLMVMAKTWYAEGNNVPIAFAGEYWDHGSVSYMTPHATESYMQPLGPYTITAVDNPKKVFYGPNTLSSINDYYKFAYISYPGYAGGHVSIRAYDGATKKFTVEGTEGADPTWTVGGEFTIFAAGGDDGVGGYAPTGAMPYANTMMSPAAAFAYWHRKFVQNDAAGAAIFKTHYDSFWSGGYLKWFDPYTQKEWNECVLWMPNGVGYIIAADEMRDTQFDSLAGATAPVEVSLYGLTGPHSGLVDEASEEFTVTLGGGTLAAPVTITPSASAGSGSFTPATVELTDSVRSATFTFTPTTPGARDILLSNDGGLTDPAAFSYNVTVEGAVTGYTFTGPTGGYLNQASAPFTVTLKEGTVTGTITLIMNSDLAGTLNPTQIVLTDSVRSGMFTYTPTVLGTGNISITNANGLPNELPIAYTTIAEPSGQPPLVPTPVDPGTQYPIILSGSRVTFIIPWDGKP